MGSSFPHRLFFTFLFLFHPSYHPSHSLFLDSFHLSIFTRPPLAPLFNLSRAVPFPTQGEAEGRIQRGGGGWRVRLLSTLSGARYPDSSIFHTYPLSQLSSVFLSLEAPPTGFFAGAYIMANHKRAVVLHCLRHMQAARKYFNNCEKRGKFIIFLVCYANVSVFSREIKEPPTYLSSKNKKIRDRVDSRVKLVWRLRIMGSWVMGS